MERGSEELARIMLNIIRGNYLTPENLAIVLADRAEEYYEGIENEETPAE